MDSRKKKSKNTEKYHISHTGGENGEAGKDVCISESNRDKKYTTEVIKIIVAKLDLKASLSFLSVSSMHLSVPQCDLVTHLVGV